ncbi:hypothetical protein Fleli_0822 [Bernardetia litoralis DSM 6794]|uniref:Glycosyltransferase RgtA/B/C/D-like domain-containing protein n=1 Tax=Bernardetia litoralis (strain ATCC 23117 / DSM 6794 / NBRC 15988 / NCIMB 1366 / Fx l1 / Sio-4) TaxID=880071 RepID=I4AH45_BERLS|nr:hypothetical protein [Bernardetia litoralis]AFM03280.1 hypothetical protein Fleli_0822 [Bernardetia litoralis DSM 6794]
MAKKKKSKAISNKETQSVSNNISSQKATHKKQIESISEDTNMLFSPISTKLAFILTLVAACLYFAFSFVSEGFYQQDEAVHYVSMKRFWFNPNRILSNWEKPGFKLVYALPSLLGVYFVTFFNCLLAAFSGFFAFKLAQKINVKIPALALIFLLTQPFWIGLSFRNYSELLAAFLLILAVYLNEDKKYAFAALAASYIVFIRQEFYPFLALYFFFLLYKKQWLPALLTGVFPLVHNFWGFAITGDFLYLLNQVLKTSSEIGDQYPRQGFDHYFLMSATVYGGIIITLIVAYFTLKVFQKKIPHVTVAILPTLYFLMYCVFNIQSVPIGPATAGNLRYLIIIAPLFSVLGALAIEEYRNTENAWKVIYTLIPMALLVGIYMTFPDNQIMLLDNDYAARMAKAGREFQVERYFVPLIAVIGTIIILIIGLSFSQARIAFAVFAIFLAFITLKPKPLSEEDSNVKSMAKWYENFTEQYGETPILVNHQLFYYYLDETPETFKIEPKSIDSMTVANLPQNGLILWDSHYSYRPEQNKTMLNYKFFLENPQKFDKVQEFWANDRSFVGFVFRKK